MGLSGIGLITPHRRYLMPIQQVLCPLIEGC
jgi:hypothetical protein